MILPTVARRFARQVKPLTVTATATRMYAAHVEYGAKFDDEWVSYFKKTNSKNKLYLGLNRIFTEDVIPAISVVEAAFDASRRLNDFATTVRILEAVRDKMEKDADYEWYIKQLTPKMKELGVVTPEELFKGVERVYREDYDGLFVDRTK